MAGSSYMEVVQILVKVAKQPEVHRLQFAVVYVSHVRIVCPLVCSTVWMH